MPIKSVLKKTGTLLKGTFTEFVADNALRLSAALSCYILFSLTPLLIIIISLCGIFFGEQAVRGEVFDQINGLVGIRAATQIEETIKTVKLSTGITITKTLGVIVTLIAASGVFAEMRSALDGMWKIQSKNGNSMIKFVIERLFSFAIIGSTGLLLFIGLFINLLMDILNNQLIVYLPWFDINFYYLVNLIVLFVLLIIFFTVIFRILPSGQMSLLNCFIGAFFTAVLFMIGKFAMGTYFGRLAVTSIFGTAGTLLLILSWIYYSAIIFYLGAEFTKVYARTVGKK